MADLLQKYTLLRLNEVHMPLLVYHNNVWLDCVLLNVNELDSTVNVRLLPNNNNNNNNNNNHNNNNRILNNIRTENIHIKQHGET